MRSHCRIRYHLLMAMCRTVGRLPNRVLYGGLAPFIRWMLYSVVRYRLTVVRTNLQHSFPEKSADALRRIEKRFYRHLSEVFVDTIKLATISQHEIEERMTYCNVQQVEQAMKGRSWISAMSHFGSWELTVNYASLSDHRILAVYRPLHSEAFDLFYRNCRARFGTHPVPMNSILHETLKAMRPASQPVSIALIADQTPPWHEIKHWYRFLNQDTPFFSGLEKMALQLKLPVWFLHVRKSAPQHYVAEFIQIYDGEERVAPHEITERYIARLEAMIRETPELWMWSHRRWKHHKPADYDITHSQQLPPVS